MISRPKTAQRGLTLIELMIAMMLSLMITAGVLAVFSQGTRSHAQDDRYARMQENGRYAIQVMADDLRMTAFWGEMLSPSTITTTLTPGEDCNIGLFAAGTDLLYDDNHAGLVKTLFDPTSGSCPSLTGTIKPGADLLAIKHVAGEPTTTGKSDGVLYLRTNGTSGSFIDDAISTALPSGFNDWRYVPHIYYIRDGAVPMLCRVGINDKALAAVPADGCLAEGIEDLHLQFGIDTDGDGIDNRYVSNPTAAQIADAVTARIYLLVRSADTDPIYTNTKTYTLGDVTLGPFNDGYYRRVFTTTVALRNPSHLIQFR